MCPPLEWVHNGVSVRIVGEVKFATEKGLLSTGGDTLKDLLKVWPEALISAVYAKEPKIWMLKKGKTRTLENPLEALKAFVDYYFHCLAAPSPLLPDWADALLKKGALDFEKAFTGGTHFEDPIIQWVSHRADLLAPSAIFEDWAPYLRTVFQPLVEVMAQGKNHAAI